MRLHLPLVFCLISSAALAASTLDKTPAIDSPTPTPPGQLDFFFDHAFGLEAPKLINSPTFLLEAGVVKRLAIGVEYASSSDINGEVNEVYPEARFQALSERQGDPLDLTAMAGYDTAAKSFDGQLIFARRLGPLRGFLAARGFSDGYGVGGATFAGTVGVQIAITPSFALVGDVGKVIAANNLDAIRAFNDKIAWSGGIQLKIPFTPHSISLFASNLNTRTPEGSSRAGIASWRFGFEFDVPIRNLGRWAAIFAPPRAEEMARESQEQSERTGPARAHDAQGKQVTVDIADYSFSPDPLKIARGTTVTWVNHDDVAHTATADDHSWDSKEIAPGAKWSRTFDKPGRYPYYCTIHPDMKGTVEVR